MATECVYSVPLRLS